MKAKHWLLFGTDSRRRKPGAGTASSPATSQRAVKHGDEAVPAPVLSPPWLLSLVVCGSLACLSTRAATLYVWQDSPSPGPPYTDWFNAATNIQKAVDVAQSGDTLLVAGGVYNTGGRAVYGTMTNRVAIDKAIRVESLMGPEVTIIQGYQVPGTTNGNEKASDRRLARPTLRGALLGLENGTRQTILPVGAGRSRTTPHIVLSGAFLALPASDCNGWPRRWVQGGRRDWHP